MAFTRSFYDDKRTEIRLRQSTLQGDMQNNVPGNGDTPFYVEDPQIRIQGWGGNLWTKCTDLESELLNINRPLNHDELKYYQFTNPHFKTDSHPMKYPSTKDLTTGQSRVTHPAWTYLDKEQVLWGFPQLDPQENVICPFSRNVSTRILEKDYYVAQIPCDLPTNGTFPLPSSRITNPTQNRELEYGNA